jgi:hypothetical protein
VREIHTRAREEKIRGRAERPEQGRELLRVETVVKPDKTGRWRENRERTVYAAIACSKATRSVTTAG